MSSWVVLDYENRVKGYATWDSKIDPPWPEVRGRLVSFDPNNVPSIGDIFDDRRSPVEIFWPIFKKFVIRWGGWIIAAAALLDKVL